MKVFFKTKKLETQFEINCIRKSWNRVTAEKILQRMNELAAAPNLAELDHLPPTRCHELKNKDKGRFSVSAGDKVRIVFEPCHDPIPRKLDRGIDRNLVTEIRISFLGDYHE